MAVPTIRTQRSPGGGDNLYLASIVALDADTGKYVWHYQVEPPRSLGLQLHAANMILADARHRRQATQGAACRRPTNGFFYVLDRKSAAS